MTEEERPREPREDTGDEAAPEPGALDRLRRRFGHRIRQWRGLEPGAGIQVRCDREKRGGWWICPLALQPKDLVYSFDMGADLELERTLVRDFDARVHLFDPDPAVRDRAEALGLEDHLSIHPVRIGPEDRPALPGAGPRHAEMRRLAPLMEGLGHRRIDLVKLNIQPPASVIRDLARLGVDVRQFLVAFPTRQTRQNREQVDAMVASLEKIGHRIFHVNAETGRYSFLRTDFGPS